MLAWAAWQLQFSPTACGTLRKHVTKPLTQPAAPDCRGRSSLFLFLGQASDHFIHCLRARAPGESSHCPLLKQTLFRLHHDNTQHSDVRVRIFGDRFHRLVVKYSSNFRHKFGGVESNARHLLQAGFNQSLTPASSILVSQTFF